MAWLALVSSYVQKNCSLRCLLRRTDEFFFLHVAHPSQAGLHIEYPVFFPLVLKTFFQLIYSFDNCIRFNIHHVPTFKNHQIRFLLVLSTVRHLFWFVIFLRLSWTAWSSSQFSALQLFLTGRTRLTLHRPLCPFYFFWPLNKSRTGERNIFL